MEEQKNQNVEQCNMSLQDFIRVLYDLDEADVVIRHEGVQINKTEMISKIMNVDEFEVLVKLLNKIQKQSNYSFYTEIEAVIYRVLTDACNRARKEGLLFNIKESYGRDEQCREMTIYTIQS